MNKNLSGVNPLYKRLVSLLTNSGVFFETYGKRQIIIHSGYLSGLIITPSRSYCSVQSPLFGTQKKVVHGYSFCVNYSLESLFYKLYKFNVLDFDGYSFCVRLIDHRSADNVLELLPCN